MSSYTKLSILAIALAVVGISAYAEKNKDSDALAVTQAKTSLTQAIATAEQHVNGKASHAEYEHSKKGWVYEVDVVSGSKLFEVKIDADTGAVIASKEAKVDDEHEEKE
ncbi:PepSY domain-containing protein [Collimonas humicola]|uniref:PepSY domain-containing protein n=1 Tax=Collimonas humicola TaxID=2825886 RepID=UPI001B8B728D|nr:PepSY domain-containing protein [Collimonas humicola]